MKPTMIDLFAGRLGWSMPFVEMGWSVIAIDLVKPDMDIPEGVEFIQADILAMTAADLAQYGAIFATCSSPCEEFSIHGLKCFHPNPKYPAMGMALFNHARTIMEQLGICYVMENVRSAEKFVGKSVNHCGPFYLWGPGVPAIFPKEAYRITKGTKFGLDKDGTRNGRKLHDEYYRTGSKSKTRAQHTARVAKIPSIIAKAIAQVALSYIPAETA